mgnify:CR=1 FL=1
MDLIGKASLNEFQRKDICMPCPTRKRNLQGPHSHILINDGGRGSNRGSPTIRICLPRIQSLLFCISENMPQYFCIGKFYYLSSGRRPKKLTPGVFHRPKKIPFAKTFTPKKILRSFPSLKYVSGAPGTTALRFFWNSPPLKKPLSL